MNKVKTIEFSYGSFVHPKVIRNLPQTVRIKNENFITLFDQNYKPLNGEKLKVGKELFIQNGRYNMQASYVDEIKEYNEAKEKKMKDEAKRKTEELKRKRKEFWSQYDIPFDFSVEIKENLSGLSFNSMGNGTKKNTVFHIYVQEDFQHGRLKRKKNDFFCSPSKARWGGDWSGTLGDHDWEKRIITCKTCLKKLERFKKL